LQRVPCINTKSSGSNPFLISKDQGKNYTRQYANLYFMRLVKLKKRVQAKAAAKWSSVKDATPLNRVLDVDQGQMCWIVGTIYLEMKLKPNVIAELALEHNLVAPPPLQKMYSDEDVVSLEDESGRVTLVGEHIQNHRWNLVTGKLDL
jgi:DNA polymerase delta subunit 2